MYLSKSNKSGHKGVYRNNSKNWAAGITYQSKWYYLGSFNSIEEAIDVRKMAEMHIINDDFNKWLTEYKNRRLEYINANLSTANKSGLKGVYKDKSNKWVAQITYQYKGYYLGSFNSIEEAIAVRKIAEMHIVKDDFYKWFTEHKNMRIMVNNNCHKSLNKKLSKANKSGHKGVHKNHSNKWIAQIEYQNKGYNLGSFNSIEEAIAIREMAEMHIINDDFNKWLAEYKSFKANQLKK